MARKRHLLLVAGAFALSGCAASIAASALGVAARSARGQPQGNHHLRPAAQKLCSEQAAAYGTVHVIDVEQRSASKIIVWGTVDDGTQKRSFECTFGTRITGFKLRPIAPRG